MGKSVAIGGHARGLLGTTRSDNWWAEPLATGAGFLAFALYATWAAFQGDHYWYGSYLSPFYSPVLFVEPSVSGAAPIAHAWFGGWPTWWPNFIPASPAILILAGPLSFRMTCYYYRKFYYRSYFLTPPGCAVNPVSFPLGYSGEKRLFLFQNLHRYTLYLAIAYIFILYYDAFLAFYRNGQWGVGVGSLILLINPTLLACYTFGCHAFRHLIGGRLDCHSCAAGKEQTVHKMWRGVSVLNARHMLWAWCSLVWVALTDVYVRLCSMGIIKDFNTWD